MKERLVDKPESEFAEALTDSRTLSLLIARIKLLVTNSKEKKTSRQYLGLNNALEKLSTIIGVKKTIKKSNETADTMPFVGGLPRWVLQVDSQFAQYINPPGEGHQDWILKRREIWNCFEATVPSEIRDQLLGWRWKAELNAFRKMREDLDKSRAKMHAIEKLLDAEDTRSAKTDGAPGLFDRLKILMWSRRIKEDERQLELFEAEKQKKTDEIGEVLRDCERIAAMIAIEMKSTCVDCGDFYPTVFEECVRAMDNEIKKEFSVSIDEKIIKNESLERDISARTHAHESEMRKLNSPGHKMNRAIDGEWDRLFKDSQELIQREFLCLNAFEMEQQEDARIRWKSAVDQMAKLVRTAEESLLHGRGFN
ncbi:MAG: hypothetical protein RI953_1445 [Pseudomonadota bacterium]|jgi:hypothetical protein